MAPEEHKALLEKKEQERIEKKKKELRFFYRKSFDELL